MLLDRDDQLLRVGHEDVDVNQPDKKGYVINDLKYIVIVSLIIIYNYVDIQTVKSFSIDCFIPRRIPKVAAVLQGHVAVVNLFLEREGDVNVFFSTKYEGKTLLEWAREKEFTELVKLFEEVAARQ